MVQAVLIVLAFNMMAGIGGSSNDKVLHVKSMKT